MWWRCIRTTPSHQHEMSIESRAAHLKPSSASEAELYMESKSNHPKQIQSSKPMTCVGSEAEQHNQSSASEAEPRIKRRATARDETASRGRQRGAGASDLDDGGVGGLRRAVSRRGRPERRLPDRRPQAVPRLAVRVHRAGLRDDHRDRQVRVVRVHEADRHPCTRWWRGGGACMHGHPRHGYDP